MKSDLGWNRLRDATGSFLFFHDFFNDSYETVQYEEVAHMELGALILATGLCMLALVANHILVHNDMLREEEKRKKNSKWNWD